LLLKLLSLLLPQLFLTTSKRRSKQLEKNLKKTNDEMMMTMTMAFSFFVVALFVPMLEPNIGFVDVGQDCVEPRGKYAYKNRQKALQNFEHNLTTTTTTKHTQQTKQQLLSQAKLTENAPLLFCEVKLESSCFGCCSVI
jgi:hypothetical protein